MRFRVEAWRRSRDGDAQVKVTEALFTFVAVDSGARPRLDQCLHRSSLDYGKILGAGARGWHSGGKLRNALSSHETARSSSRMETLIAFGVGYE